MNYYEKIVLGYLTLSSLTSKTSNQFNLEFIIKIGIIVQDDGVKFSLRVSKEIK